MQLYAEEAVDANLANLQKEFLKQAKTNKNAQFIKLSDAETEKLMDRARKAYERWRQMSSQGKSES